MWVCMMCVRRYANSNQTTGYMHSKLPETYSPCCQDDGVDCYSVHTGTDYYHTVCPVMCRLSNMPPEKTDHVIHVNQRLVDNVVP